MGWFTSTSSSRHGHSSSSRPGYARSYAGSSYSSSARHHASTSRYKRSPRDGYMQYLYQKFKHLLRQLYAYARRHPYKVFFMIVMPLVSGGVLHKLARQFGVNLPAMGTAAGAAASGSHGAGSYYGSQGYGGERSGGSGGGGFADLVTGANIQSVATGIGGLASIAKMAQGFL